MDGSGPQANNTLEIIEFANCGDNLGFFKTEMSSYSTVTLKLAHEEEQYCLYMLFNLQEWNVLFPILNMECIKPADIYVLLSQGLGNRSFWGLWNGAWKR